MLVNATEMLIKARDGHYGVPQFNINNLEWTKAVLTACEEMKSPVILGVSEGAGKYMTGFKTVAAMVDAMVDSMRLQTTVRTGTLFLRFAPPRRLASLCLRHCSTCVAQIIRGMMI